MPRRDPGKENNLLARAKELEREGVKVDLQWRKVSE